MGPLTWTAAVLCSSAGAGGCDHLDCHHGPFIVVVVRSAFGTAGVVETSDEASGGARGASAPTTHPEHVEFP